MAGWLAATHGNRAALGVSAAGLVVVTLLLAASSFRRAVLPGERIAA